MQVTIDIEPGTYSLLEKIKDRGLSLDDVLHDALDKFEADDHPQRKMTSEDWIRSLKEWTGKRAGEGSPVSDEALRRAELYNDRT